MSYKVYGILSNKKIFTCSVTDAFIDLQVGSSYSAAYQYDCKAGLQNASMTDVTTRSYKIECKPRYTDSLPIFKVPKRSEDATIECRAYKQVEEYLPVTWAVPCNKIQECYNGDDENGCEFPFWTVPSILCGTCLALCITFVAYLYQYSSNDWNEIMQDRRWRLAIQQKTCKESEKAYNIALMAHAEDLTGIMNIFTSEVDFHGSEATAICYLKVQLHFFFKNKLFLTVHTG